MYSYVPTLNKSSDYVVRKKLADVIIYVDRYRVFLL